MSVATLSADTSVKTVVGRAEKKPSKADGDPATEFRNMVKGETRRDAASVDKGEKGSGEKNGHTGKAGDDGDRVVWRRYDAIFDRTADKLVSGDKKTAEEGESSEAEGSVGETAEGDVAEAETNAVATTGNAISAERMSPKAEAAIAQARTAPAEPTRNGADGQVVSAVARNAETPGEARTATPAALMAGTAAVQAQQPDGQQRAMPNAARAAAAEQAPGASQSSAQGIVVPRGEAGDEAATKGDGGQRDGQNNEQMASRQQGQAQNGNRISGVTVVSQQVTPAMPPQPAAMSATSASFVDSLANSITSAERTEAANQASFAQSAGKSGPITTLRIQLHPAELGMVTARLSGSEAQLAIEITVDNAEARHRLASDSDSIITALRNIGIEVDRVTIQQSQANTGTNPNGAGRGNEFSQSGDSRGERQDQASRQGSERDHGRNQQGGQGGPNSDMAGGGVYI
jgi:chemotaxis protein MotD